MTDSITTLTIEMTEVNINGFIFILIMKNIFMLGITSERNWIKW